MSGRRSSYHDLPEDVLDPRLLPADLLRSPGTWQPASSGIDPKALHQAHPDLRGDQDLLSSGRLADILLGRASLYADLPPVHLSAYLDVCGPPPDVNWNSISSAPSSIWQAMAGGDFAQGALSARTSTVTNRWSSLQSARSKSASPQHLSCWWLSTPATGKEHTS